MMQITPVRLSLIVCISGMMMVRAQTPQSSPASPAGAQQQSARIASNVIEGIEFRGLSRVPLDTVKTLILLKAGDVLSEDALRRDFMALWNTGRFDDITLKKETGERGGTIVRFVVTERP
jgi:outer membrane protein insertion porin family